MARSPSKKEEGEKRSRARKASGSGPRPKATARNNGNLGKQDSEPPTTTKATKATKETKETKDAKDKDRKASADSKNAGKERSGSDSARDRKSKSAARRETERDSNRESKEDGSADTQRKPQRRAESAEARRSRPEPESSLSGPVKLALGGSALAIFVALIALFSSMNSGPKGSSPERVVVAPPPPLGPKESAPKPSTQRPDEPSSSSGVDADPDSERPAETPEQPSEPEPSNPSENPGVEDPEPVPEPDPEPREPEKNPEAPSDASSAGSNDESLVRFRPEGETKTIRCTQVIDGDTLILSDKSKVRLIGINTPERGEPLYPEASGLLRKLVLNKDVTLSFDRERKDQFKRTLAYVFVDGHFVNGEQVRQGLAYFYEFKPNTKHSALFLKLQRSSRAANRGLWGRPIERASEYISHTKSHRYHKAGCKRLRGSEDLRWKTREEALDTGRSPCPDCKS